MESMIGFRKGIEISHIDKLQKLFSRVKESNQIMRAVNKAEMQFKRDVALIGFNDFFHTSSVHGFNDSKIQAFIMAIPSNDKEEMCKKAYLAFATHFIDDFFDRSDFPPTPQQMKEKRNDIRSLVNSVKGLGEFVDIIAASRIKNVTGFNNGLKRLMYGGLIQLAGTENEQHSYLSEYKKLGVEYVDKEVAGDILKLRDIPYWMTTKTIQEFFFSVEPTENLTLAELWSIAYAPAIYLHDWKEEQEKGELNFYTQKLPELTEMKNMLKLAKKHLPNYKDNLGNLRRAQLKILIEVFSPVFPLEILTAYQDLADNLKNK
ncbi:MAG: hypothetical protein Q8N37_01380 [bacterium]|nr:hypothetical protein [bacterium]